MSDEETNILTICDLWAKKESVSLSDKFDEIIFTLAEQYISTSFTNTKVCNLLKQCLLIRVNTIHDNNCSSLLSLSCKYLITHIVKVVLLETSVLTRPNDTDHSDINCIELFDILKTCFDHSLIIGNTHFYHSIIEEAIHIVVSRDLCQIKLSSFQTLMTLVECLLNALLHVKHSRNKFDIHNKVTFYQHSSFHDLILTILFDIRCKTLSAQVILGIIPKCLELFRERTILIILWSVISGKSDNNNRFANISISTKLYVLCGLSNYFIPDDDSHSIILTSNDFWQMIQQAVLSDEAFVRKKGLYLLKRSIESVSKTNNNIDLELFSWNYLKTEELYERWNNVLILFDVLEEKQPHLVTPVLKTILKQIEVTELYINPSWTLVIYSRLFGHDSLQVLRLSIMFFLKLKVGVYFNTSSLKSSVFDLLFFKLNNMMLFSKDQSDSEWSSIDIALSNWFINISVNLPNLSELFKSILIAIIKVRWCTVPLFHVLYNMSFMPSAEILDNAMLCSLIEFLKETIQTQNVFIRGAAQCALLNIITKYSKKNLESLTVAKLLIVFKQKECLHRGLTSWTVCKDWVKSLSMIEGRLDVHKILTDDNWTLELKARFLVVSLDAGLYELDWLFDKTLKNYFNILTDTSVRTYASVDESDKCVQMIYYVLEESVIVADRNNDIVYKFVTILLPYIKEVVPYIWKRIYSVRKLEHFRSIEMYMKCLHSICDRGLVNITEEQLIMCLEVENLFFTDKCPLIQRFFALQLVLWFLKNIKERDSLNKNLKLFCLSVLRKGHILETPLRDTSDESGTRNLKTLWGRLTSDYIHSIWMLLLQSIEKCLIEPTEIFSIIVADEFLNMATHSIETGGGGSLNSILRVIRHIEANFVDHIELYIKFVEYTWKCCFELRKVSVFWPTFQSWIEMSFNCHFIRETKMLPTLIKFSEEILHQGKSVPGLANMLLTHLIKEIKMDLKCGLPFVGFLTSALMFGPILRKDQRLENETVDQIRRFGSDYAVNSLIPQEGLQTSGEVRVSALSIVLAMFELEGGEDVVIEIVQQLLAEDKILTERRQRYHGDSLHHRLKHRILQAVLVLEAVLSQSVSAKAQACVRELIEWSWRALQADSHQPSVRYQLEWLLVRSLLHTPQGLDNFWNLFNHASEERTGSVCSFISVAYHVAATVRDSVFIDRSITEILPWCMAQHFNVRLYAQVVLQKLWPLDQQVACKYEAVHKSLHKSLNHGNAVRNAEKLKNDFYFTDFHPIDHFSLETVFWELPRLSNISKDEWVPQATLQLCYSKYVPLNSRDDKLKLFTAANWVVKASAGPDVKELEACCMQKKFVPWKSMFPEFENSRASSRTELIVVATLIDKLPNLGGLARSCEVFTAECLVVPSLEYTQDKIFSTLSMSAEKHINIVEVKPHNLAQYLREKKTAGYTLVGAEQTAASVSLETFKFPKKCLLLLGNEKEGIPPNLLPLVDVCVEVRQLGVVRSLNVHVTGALFLWEYTRQYLDC